MKQTPWLSGQTILYDGETIASLYIEDPVVNGPANAAAGRTGSGASSASGTTSGAGSASAAGPVSGSASGAGPLWQLYSTVSGGYALAVKKELHDYWVRRQMLEDGLMVPSDTDENLYLLTAAPGELISSVDYGPFTENNRQALEFAKAIKSCIKRGFPLTINSLYISTFSLILPGTFAGRGETFPGGACRGAASGDAGQRAASGDTGRGGPGLRDAARESASGDAGRILGHFLTRGMNVSVTDTDRMHKFAPWLTDETRLAILNLLDLQENQDIEENALLTMPRPLPSTEESRRKAGYNYTSEDEGSADASLDALSQSSCTFRRKPRKEGLFSLPGRPVLEKFFREEILDVIDREEEYARFGVGFPGPTLFHGPSGSGKTYAVEQLADYLGWPVFRITSGTVGSKYIHETSQKVSEMFDLAIKYAPSFLIIDEMEAFLSSRSSARVSAEAHLEEVGEFLRRLPDAAENKVLLFGMTNMPDAIDEAILRKGRFDHVLEVAMPGREEVLDVLSSLLNDLPTTGDLNLDKLAARLEGCPFSDVSYVVNEAGRISVRAHKKGIDADALNQAADQLRPAKKKRTIGFIN